MKNVGQRIKQRRIELGMSVDDLADKLNKNRATIYRYENGYIENLPLPILEPIARALKTTPAYLMGWDNIVDSTPITSFSSIPIVGTVRAGAGGIAEMDFLGYEQVHDINNPDEHRALKVKGDSMAPNIMDGDIAIVHIQPEVENGELAVVIVNGEEGTLKKFMKYENAVALISFNQNYPMRVFTGTEMNQIYIWGKVVRVTRRY